MLFQIGSHSPGRSTSSELLPPNTRHTPAPASSPRHPRVIPASVSSPHRTTPLPLRPTPRQQTRPCAVVCAKAQPVIRVSTHKGVSLFLSSFYAGRLVMYICACEAASSETMLSRDALSETDSPRRQRASCHKHTIATMSARCTISYETSKAVKWVAALTPGMASGPK